MLAVLYPRGCKVVNTAKSRWVFAVKISKHILDRVGRIELVGSGKHCRVVAELLQDLFRRSERTN